MVLSKSRHASHGNSIGNYEIQLAVRPLLGGISQFRYWRIEVGFEPILAVTVKPMASSAMLVEVLLSGFQILRGRRQRIRLRGGIAADPIGCDVTCQFVFHLAGFAKGAPVHRGH